MSDLFNVFKAVTSKKVKKKDLQVLNLGAKIKGSLFVSRKEKIQHDLKNENNMKV